MGVDNDTAVREKAKLSSMKFAFAVLVLLLICSPSHATVITAATCLQSGVAASVAQASPGDTVAIPACAQTNWSTTLTVRKCISIQGSGQTNTTLGDNVAKNGTDTSTLITYNVRCPSKTSGWGGASKGNGSWSDSTPMPGSSNQIYIEDNSWNCSGANPSQIYDGAAGARWVFRFNTVTGGNGGNHGADTSQAERGARFSELYMNAWTYLSNQSPDFMHWYRSGSGMVWGNDINSPNRINSVVKGLNCRDGTGCGPGYPPWGFCNGTSPYDQNSTTRDIAA